VKVQIIGEEKEKKKPLEKIVRNEYEDSKAINEHNTQDASGN
jgi:hypothetical protein